jgi:GNAT superfamily N-acetyltransferase
MAIKIVRNGLAAGDYLVLRKAVGFAELSPHMADASLNGSLYVVHIEADGKAAGMARVIGDDAQVFIVQEVIVAPVYQGRGFGRMLAREAIDFIESRSSYAGRVLIGLFCFEGNEGFYEKLGLLKQPDQTTAPGTIHFIELPRGA